MTAALLKRLGRPADTVVHLDFETFYSADYTLNKQTTEAYVRDDRFEATGVSVAVGRAAPVWLEEHDFRTWSARVDWSRVALNAHHTQFDGAILSWRYGIRPGFLICTMSMGRALHGEGALEKLGPRYGLGAKSEGLAAAKGKRRGDFTRAEWLKFGEYANNDVRIGQGLYYAMVPTFPRLELWVIDTTVRMFTEPVFVGNQKVLREALAKEQTKKATMLARVSQWAGGADAKTVLGSSDKFAALLGTLGEVAPMKPNAKGENIYAFAKDDPGMQGLLEHEREEIRLLAEARLSVKSNIDETRVTRMIGITERGSVPFYLKYCGAHTHRWSGGDKMNPQNFRRGGDLRDAIEAPEGQVLVVADSGQIEARVVAWVAGEARLLETFRRNDLSGGDFYSDEGGAYFGKKLSKKETPVERQLAKAMILGLGFEMGVFTFAPNLLKGMLGSDPVRFTLADVTKFGVDVSAFEKRPHGRDGPLCGTRVQDLRRDGVRLSYSDLLVHCAVAHHFVRKYRDTNKRIVALWRAMAAALEIMARPGDDAGEIRGQVGCLKIIRHGIVKPSGLVLNYPGLRKTGDGFKYIGGKSGREHLKVYGGLLTENVVQSVARDIVAEQVMRIRADGHRIGTTTHDEVVAVVPEGQGAAVLDQALAHFRVPPSWCADLPLNAEGGFGKSYGAVK